MIVQSITKLPNSKSHSETMNTVAIGITTYNRAAYLEKCAKAMKRHLFVSGAPVFTKLAVYNDGSDPKHHAEYERAFKVVRSMGGTVLDAPDNQGVAVAKNALLKTLMPYADYVILCEDDIIVKDAKAVTEYVRIAEESKVAHLSWANHGPANAAGPVEVDGDIAYYFHAVGAWSLYSRECLQNVGLFNEGFHNAWEHCELTLRLAEAGYTSGAYHYADATHANDWLSEIPNSIEKSAIRPRADWHSSIRDGLLFWQKNLPDTFAELFGPDKPLHAYAQSIIGE